jgi:integrase
MSNTQAITIAARWPQVAATWLDTLDSPRTKQEYAKFLRRAFAQIGDLDDVSDPESAKPFASRLAAFRAGLLARHDEGALSSSSVATELAAVRSFLRHAYRFGETRLPPDVSSELLKSPRVSVERPYQALARDEIDALAEASLTARDRCMILLAAETGARCNELLNIRLSDFAQSDTGVFFVRITKGKGGKVRDVPLSSRAIEAVRAFIAEDGQKFGDDAYLFEHHDSTGKRLTTARARQLFARSVKQAGLSKAASWHALRHSAALRWLRKPGGSTAHVQKLLGHASIATTERYLDHLALDELAGLVE